MIQPTYVTVKQAIALKDKGFDEESNNVIKENLEPGKSHYLSMRNSDIEAGTICTRPEQWMVIEWLFLKYLIDVSTIPVKEKDSKSVYFQFRAINFSDSDVIEVMYEHQYNSSYELFPSKQEAYSAAFDYILTNLI